MKHKTFLRRYTALAAMALLFCSALLINSNARAQCPDSTFPGPSPDSIPWTQDTSYVPVYGTDCYMYVFYCQRAISGTPDTIQAWLDGVEFDSTTDCDSIPDSSLVNDAQLQLDSIVTLQNENLLEPCFKGHIVVTQAYTPECWTPVSGGGAGSGGHSVTIYPCSAPGYYCKRQCDACWDAGPPPHLVFSNCQVTTSAVDAECMQYGPWNEGGCYSASCADWYLPPPIEGRLNVEPASVIDMSLVAFPNPTSGTLTISSTVAGEPLQVLDVLGREMIKGVIPANGSLVIDVSSITAGTYYVSAGHKEVKFVKQ